ncbi:MAG: hypothetical protein AAGF73_05035 [Actinomycetota bacterium]
MKRAVLMLVVLVVASCSNDGGNSSDSRAPADSVLSTTEAPADEAAQSAGLPAECVMPPYDVEIRTAATGPNETFTVVDAEDNGLGVRAMGSPPTPASTPPAAARSFTRTTSTSAPISPSRANSGSNSAVS